MTKIDPWEIKGDIDYDKLFKEFGIKPLEHLPKKFYENILFRKKTIFAHRDYKQIVECIQEKKPFVMMTGLMPTGKMHIGHMLVALQMIFYQKMGAKVYIAVADVEAHNARGQSFEESKRIAMEEYIPNYIALGLEPKNCEIYFQSNRSKDSKKSNAYYRLQNELARHVTFSEFKAVYGEITPGKMLAALLQAADMFHPQLPEFEGPIPTVIPVGVDQDPHIRLARDICKRYKTSKFEQISSTYHKFLPGLTGGKMSASDPSSYIALNDTSSQAKKKINKFAFSGGQPTLEEHRKKGGNPDIDISYQYLNLFFEDDDEKLKQIYQDYKSGKLLSGELKAILIEKLGKFLDELAVKREKAKSRIKDFISN
ncbi:tryptophan--tRNA ligase [Candidatus Woesearchaeota archaeon]|nr:tryptophan--tRNA ligase [Candidatus Woesearchaeota archaeon]